jgi:hypothetical protein
MRGISRNPYHGPKNAQRLRPSVLALIDILGYSELIEEAERQNRQEEVFNELYQALLHGRNGLEGKGSGLPRIRKLANKDFYVLKAFTDNIVIAWPIRDDAEVELGQAITRLAYFQFDMSLRGFFVRGAIAVGKAYVDDIAVFGDALTEAYAGESKPARDPRVILTKNSVAATKHHLRYYGNPNHSPQASDLLKDPDGQWFVNYLEAVMIAVDEVGPFYKEFAKHKQAVEEKLNKYAGSPVIFAKYAWVANYHNFFCDLYGQYFSDEHKINAKLLRPKPTLITE